MCPPSSYAIPRHVKRPELQQATQPPNPPISHHPNELSDLPYYHSLGLDVRHSMQTHIWISVLGHYSTRTRFTSVSCSVPPSRILIMHSSSLCEPNSFSRVDLLAESYAFCAPCLFSSQKSHHQHIMNQLKFMPNLIHE